MTKDVTLTRTTVPDWDHLIKALEATDEDVGFHCTARTARLIAEALKRLRNTHEPTSELPEKLRDPGKVMERVRAIEYAQMECAVKGCGRFRAAGDPLMCAEHREFHNVLNSQQSEKTSQP